MLHLYYKAARQERERQLKDVARQHEAALGRSRVRPKTPRRAAQGVLSRLLVVRSRTASFGESDC